MYVLITNPFFSAGIRGGVAVPIPDGDKFELIDDGEILAAAHAHESGCYTTGQGTGILYHSWETALADQTSLTEAEVSDLETQEAWG